MSHLMDEIASQPECWAKAIEMAALAGPALPAPGERVAVIGCGSSLNVARCYAALREAAGHGETDAFPASEVPATRRYDRMVFVSRTGTTTEVLDALRRVPSGVTTTAVAADPGSPLPARGGYGRPAGFFGRTVRGLQPLHHQHDRPAPRAPGRGPPRPAGRRRSRTGPAAAARTGRTPRVHLPRPRLGGRGGRRGGAEAARGLAHLGRVVPGDGVPARPDQRQRPRHRGLGPGRGAVQPAGRRPPHRRHGHRPGRPTRSSG